MRSLSDSIPASNGSRARCSSGLNPSAFFGFMLRTLHPRNRSPYDFASPRAVFTSAVRARTSPARARIRVRSACALALRCCTGDSSCGSIRARRANVCASKRSSLRRLSPINRTLRACATITSCPNPLSSRLTHGECIPVSTAIGAKIESIMKHRGTENAVLPAHPEATISVVEAAIPAQARKDLSVGKQLLEKGQDLDKGIQLLQKAAQEYPKYAEAYLLMGIAYGHQNKWSDASSALDRAIEIDPKYTAAYLALGALNNQQKKFAEAETPLLKAVELNPDSADVQLQLARTYWGLNRWQDADSHAQKAVQLAPNIAEGHVLLGNILLRKQDAPGALREFKESLRLVPNGPLAEPTRQVVSKIEAALKSSQQQTPSM